VIDDSDADFALLASMGSTGWVGFLLLVLAIVLYVVAADNAAECAERSCRVGVAKLIDHECVCVEAPASERRRP
jgi:hypothetical protein